MDIILLIISIIAVLLVLPLTVVSIIRSRKKSYRTSENNTVFHKTNYTPDVQVATELQYDKVKSGKIRRHILTNSASYYDSGVTVKQYKSFLSSPIMKSLVIERKEERYYG